MTDAAAWEDQLIAEMRANGGKVDSGPLAGHPLSDLVQAMRTGNAYVNLHTSDGVDPPNTGAGDFPGGEIRCQIARVESENATYAGLGLGLFMVRKVVDAHGGRVSVDCAPELGTTFTVVLPRHP